MLFQLKEDVDRINIHDITKRQSGDDCQCNDGTPGPRGPPGPKEMKGNKDVKVMLVLQDQEVILEIEDLEE